MFPIQVLPRPVVIQRTFGTSQGPMHPAMVSWIDFSRPLRRHSSLSHATGTSGCPFSTCPQQQPAQTSTSANLIRLVRSSANGQFLSGVHPCAPVLARKRGHQPRRIEDERHLGSNVDEGGQQWIQQPKCGKIY